MFHQHAQLGGEMRNRADLFADHCSTDSDVPQQTALRGVIDTPAVAKLVDFPDVMKDDAGENEIGVQFTIMFRYRAAQSDQTYDVFEQSADESVMHGHRSRRTLQLRRDLGLIYHARQQPLEPRISHRRNSRAKVRIQFLDIVLRMRQEIGEVVIALHRWNDLLQHQLFLAVVKFHAAANVHHIVAEILPVRSTKSSSSQDFPERDEVRISFSRTKNNVAIPWPSCKSQM